MISVLAKYSLSIYKQLHIIDQIKEKAKIVTTIQTIANIPLRAILNSFQVSTIYNNNPFFFTFI